MQVLARTLVLISLVEIRDIDNQRVSFPVTTRVSVSLANRRRQMRSVCNGNHAAESLPLADVVVDGYGAFSLDNARHTAKGAGLQQHRHIRSEAAFGAASIFRTIGAIHSIEVVVRRPFGSAWRYRPGFSARCALQQCREIFLLRPNPVLRIFR